MTVHPFAATGVPYQAFTLAAVAVLTAGAWLASALPPGEAHLATSPALTRSAPPPGLKHGHDSVSAAGAPRGDDQDDEEDDAPEEPQLQLLPIVHLSDPQALAV